MRCLNCNLNFRIGRNDVSDLQQGASFHDKNIYSLYVFKTYDDMKNIQLKPRIVVEIRVRKDCLDFFILIPMILNRIIYYCNQNIQSLLISSPQFYHQQDIVGSVTFVIIHVGIVLKTISDIRKFAHNTSTNKKDLQDVDGHNNFRCVVPSLVILTHLSIACRTRDVCTKFLYESNFASIQFKSDAIIIIIIIRAVLGVLDYEANGYGFDSRDRKIFAG